MKWVVTMLLGLGLMTPDPGHAKNCAVNQLKYTNKSAGYDVYKITIDYKTGDKRKRIYAWKMPNRNDELINRPPLSKGQSHTFDLTKYDSELTGSDDVWLRIFIEGGDEVSCRKDNHKMVYDPTGGGLVKVKSGGTSLKDNRCKFAEDIDTVCITR